MKSGYLAHQKPNSYMSDQHMALVIVVDQFVLKKPLAPSAVDSFISK